MIANWYNSGNTNTDYQVITCQRSGSTQSVNINSATTVSNSSALDDPGIDAAHIGSVAGSSLFLTGSIAEIAIYNRALTTMEIKSVEVYLSNKWGVAL